MNNLFERSLDYNWDMEPVDRSLDPSKVNAYLEQLEEPDRSFIRDLLANTRYVPYSEFKEALLRTFQQFNADNFYILFPEGKFGSEHWITALLWPQLREKNILGFIDTSTQLPIKETNIVIIDDCIYTGHSVIGMLDGFTYDLATQFVSDDGKSLEKINEISRKQKEIAQYFHFHIIVPFISKDGTKENFIDFLWERFGIKATLYYDQYVYQLDELIDLSKYYPDQDEEDEYLYQRFNFESPFQTLIYFDHKVADQFCTYRNIYVDGYIPQTKENFGLLLKNNYSREKIEELEKLYNQ